MNADVRDQIDGSRSKNVITQPPAHSGAKKFHTQTLQSSPTETSCFSSGLHRTLFTREEWHTPDAISVPAWISAAHEQPPAVSARSRQQARRMVHTHPTP